MMVFMTVVVIVGVIKPIWRLLNTGDDGITDFRGVDGKDSRIKWSGLAAGAAIGGVLMAVEICKFWRCGAFWHKVCVRIFDLSSRKTIFTQIH